MTRVTRRRSLLHAAALASAAALPGCSWLDDAFETHKVPIPGKREQVLPGASGLQADAADHRPILLPKPVMNADWPQAGDSPSHVMGNRALGSLGSNWKRSIGEGGGYRQQITASPVAAGGRVFTMDSDGVVRAFAIATGQQAWSAQTQPKKDRSTNVGGGLGMAGGVLYATTGRAEALAMDPNDGKILWRTPLNAPARSAPTINDGKLFFSTIDERLLCLSADGGKPLWSYQATPSATIFLGEPAPAVADGLVVAGFGSGDLLALRADSGTLAWGDSLAATRGRSSLSDISAIRALPVVSDGTIYAIGLGGLMVALDLRSGRRVWERNTSGQQTPCLAGDWLFVLTDQQALVCLSAADGRVRWLSQMPRYRNEEKSRGPIFWTGPLLGGDYLYLAGSSNRLIAVNPGTGAITGEQKLPDRPAVPMVAASGKLFVVTDDGMLTAFG